MANTINNSIRNNTGRTGLSGAFGPVTDAEKNISRVPFGAPRTPTSQSLGGASGLEGPGPGSNPGSTINQGIQSNMGVASYNFPADLPRYHFGIIECDWTIALTTAGTLKPVKQYRLPLPMPLIDNFSVMYDTNFNYNIAAGAVSGSFGASAVAAFTGVTFNNFKAVTLSQPEFRRIQFQWKFSPRNAAEARAIRQITYGLRYGMTPRTRASKLVFEFPRIYVLYFYPNSKYLYKFKPVVLESISVDYAGGNPVPSFYQTSNPEDTPPESVMMSTTWLELEYWTQQDYKGTDAMPTSAEFDNWNYYQLDGVTGGDI